MILLLVYLFYFLLITLTFTIYKQFYLHKYELLDNTDVQNFLFDFQYLFLNLVLALLFAVTIVHFRREIKLKFIYYRKFVRTDEDEGYLYNRTILIKKKGPFLNSETSYKMAEHINLLLAINNTPGRLVGFLHYIDIKKIVRTEMSLAKRTYYYDDVGRFGKLYVSKFCLKLFPKVLL